MDPLTMGLLTGGANLLGSVFSSQQSGQNTQDQIAAQQGMQKESEAFNEAEAQKSRDFGAQQAEINRNYQTSMSSTAYQRSAADMKAAGLNPMMMFGSGGAASTPGGAVGSGSSASVGTPSVPMSQKQSPFAGIGDAVGKMVNSAINVKTFDKMTQEIANLQTQQAQTAAQTATEKERPALVREQALETANTAALKGMGLPAARFSAKQGEDLLRMPDWLRSSLTQAGFTGGKISQTLDPVLGLISGAKGVKSLMPSRTTSETTSSRTGDSTFVDRWAY